MLTTLENFPTEIKKFAIGNFIEDDLKSTATKILKNQISNLTIHPISIIIYNETGSLKPGTAQEIKQQIRDAILHQCKKIEPKIYASMDAVVLDRMTYIVMPVWDLNGLLEEFVGAL
jgi:methionyl-tRNA synthetase